MTEKDAFAGRKKGQEEEYFRKQEQALIEQMRARQQAEAERQQMAEALGLADDEILRELQALGYTRETVSLLHLAPLVQVAWAEGKVTEGERRLIHDLARSRGIEAGSPVDQRLTGWLDERPAEDFFERTLRIIRALLQALPPDERAARRRDLLSHCAQVATASGGLLGYGKVSEAEQTLLDRIAAELERDPP
jgi:hypothetical protein